MERRAFLKTLPLIGSAVSHAAKALAAGLSDHGAFGEFALTDQTGQAFSSSALKGKVWVAAFGFTRCPMVCPNMFGSLKRIARETDAPIAWFSTDPEYDTPQVLREKAAELRADPRQWKLLTGPRPTIDALQTRFSLVDKSNPGLHTTRLFLIDGQGRIRGAYEGQTRQGDGASNDINALLRDMKILQEEQKKAPAR